MWMGSSSIEVMPAGLKDRLAKKLAGPRIAARVVRRDDRGLSQEEGKNIRGKCSRCSRNRARLLARRKIRKIDGGCQSIVGEQPGCSRRAKLRFRLRRNLVMAPENRPPADLRHAA